MYHVIPDENKNVMSFQMQKQREESHSLLAKGRDQGKICLFKLKLHLLSVLLLFPLVKLRITDFPSLLLTVSQST